MAESEQEEMGCPVSVLLRNGVGPRDSQRPAVNFQTTREKRMEWDRLGAALVLGPELGARHHFCPPDGRISFCSYSAGRAACQFPFKAPPILNGPCCIS